MNQAMFLPHQILGCFFSAGKMELIAGNGAACHYNPTLQQMTFLTQIDHQKHHQSEALSLFWKDLENTSWFKTHPVVSVTFLKMFWRHTIFDHAGDIMLKCSLLRKKVKLCQTSFVTHTHLTQILRTHQWTWIVSFHFASTVMVVKQCAT